MGPGKPVDPAKTNQKTTGATKEQRTIQRKIPSPKPNPKLTPSATVQLTLTSLCAPQAYCCVQSQLFHPIGSAQSEITAAQPARGRIGMCSQEYVHEVQEPRTKLAARKEPSPSKREWSHGVAPRKKARPPPGNAGPALSGRTRKPQLAVVVIASSIIDRHKINPAKHFSRLGGSNRHKVS